MRSPGLENCLPKKTAFQLILQRVVGMWVDFFVLAPNHNSGWALVNCKSKYMPASNKPSNTRKWVCSSMGKKPQRHTCPQAKKLC